MPRISRFEILKKREQPTLFIRDKTKVEDLPMLIGEKYGKMAAYLEELGEYLSDVPYVAYHNMDMQNLDVEIGFPVAKALAGKGEIQAGIIPAGMIAFCMYRGAYHEIEPVYDEMVQWMAENNHRPIGTVYEHYYNDYEFSESELLTMIVMPFA